MKILIFPLDNQQIADDRYNSDLMYVIFLRSDIKRLANFY